jgi:hypothetical protein
MRTAVAERYFSFALGVVPLAGAAVGAWLDERHHLGFTNWRSACRAAGFSLRSLTTFSFELLPTAIIGLLAGGLILQAGGFALRRDGGHAQRCFAAHAGCALTMPIGMSLCALAIPLPMAFGAELALAAAGAWIVHSIVFRRAASAADIHP